jgi:hypothetical protein
VLYIENILDCTLINVIESREVGLTGPEARMGDTRYVIYTKMLTQEPEGNKLTLDRI